MFGGLNGDGYFDEEYSGGGYEVGEGCPYGYRSPKNLKDFGLTKTGVTSKKAVQFNYKDLGTVWLPKSVLTKPHLDYIDDDAVSLMWENIKLMAKAMR